MHLTPQHIGELLVERMQDYLLFRGSSELMETVWTLLMRECYSDTKYHFALLLPNFSYNFQCNLGIIRSAMFIDNSWHLYTIAGPDQNENIYLLRSVFFFLYLLSD